MWFEIEKDQTCNVLRDATSEPLTGWDTNKSLRRVNWWVQHFITVWVHFIKDLFCICTPLLLSWCMSKNMSNHMIVAWCEGSIERWLHYWHHNRKRQLNLGHKKYLDLDKASQTMCFVIVQCKDGPWSLGNYSNHALRIEHCFLFRKLFNLLKYLISREAP